MPWSAQRLVLTDEGPSQLWVMNRPGSKRFPVIMMSVSAQWGVCAAWKKLPAARQTFIQRAGPSPAFPARSPTQQTVPAAYLHAVSLSFSVIILICSIHSNFAWLSVPAQEADDVARVSEAVTKAVVCALKSAPSDDNTDDWLNPTEVAN